jgi:hypothetical protein
MSPRQTTWLLLLVLALAGLLLSSGCARRGNSPVFQHLHKAHAVPAGPELCAAVAHPI